MYTKEDGISYMGAAYHNSAGTGTTALVCGRYYYSNCYSQLPSYLKGLCYKVRCALEGINVLI